MPQFKIKGMELEQICSISKPMVDELQELLDCPRNYFLLESINSTFIMDGSITTVYPIIEISWFHRGQEVQDKMAKIVTKYVHNIGYKDVDVIFKVLEASKYYENGEHF